MKALLERLLRRDPAQAAAHRIYLSIVQQARRPEFYAVGGVPDSVDGRFDMIVLHPFLVLRRMKAAGGDQDLPQRVYDLMFADMDQTLREMGVGDLSVPKHIKRMVQAFHGRVAAYESALGDSDPAALDDALARNLYGTVEPAPEVLTVMAGYMRVAERSLAKLSLEAIHGGALEFGPMPYEAAAEEER